MLILVSGGLQIRPNAENNSNIGKTRTSVFPKGLQIRPNAGIIYLKGKVQSSRLFSEPHQMEKLWNRNYCKVMAANFSLFFAFYLLTPLLPIYLSENFGASKDMIVGEVFVNFTTDDLLEHFFWFTSKFWKP